MKKKSGGAAVLALLLLSAVCVSLAPVNYFEIAAFGEEGAVLFAAPVPVGWMYSTRYIHSLQLTPVEDDYCVLDGAIWQWEERVQSHNAGLPTEAPPRGRFIVDPPWFILQGGGARSDTIVYRVGNEQFGRNLWMLSPHKTIEAYKKYPGMRTAFTATKKTLFEAQAVKP